jgi:CheY-like chemotaxis protein
MAVKVLIADDNRANREALASLLEAAGYDVWAAADGWDALMKAREERPALVISDVLMPRMDGYELARQIRALPGDKHPYLVAVTGYGLAEDRRRTREAGFDLHLVKPVDPAALAAVLARA